jgi:ABC-2 type transport system permease protein
MVVIDMERELIVALKELRDHIISKRFILIFLILLLLSAYSITTGVNNYNKALDTYKSMNTQYKQSSFYEEDIKYIQDQISMAEKGEIPSENIEPLKSFLADILNPSMPSSLMIFQDFNYYFLYIGMVLALFLGFDIISKEEEQGTLKSLLSHPVYRDTIINGKAIGSIIMLVAVIACVFLIMLAVSLYLNIIPTIDNIFWISIYFIVSLLYCVTFLSIAMAVSAITKNSTISILYVLGIALVLYMLLYISSPITDLILGPSPEFNTNSLQNGQFGQASIATNNENNQTKNLLAQSRYNDYWQKHVQVQQIICTISPIFNYQVITNGIVASGGPSIYDSGSNSLSIAPTKIDILLSFKYNIIALISAIVTSFAIAYLMFMRMDIR